MNISKIRRKSRKTTVQLTSLLDLLFIMIFISLMNTKNEVIEVTTKAQAAAKPIEVQETKKIERKTEREIKAIFHFYSTPRNQNLPTGTYLMSGTYNEANGELRLGGISWVNRPQGYDMVPLNGVINETGTEFRGRIDYMDCDEFTLRRSSVISRSDIAGQWDGIYVCSQGETGLSLTIH